jgi:hypothetical protein
MSEVKEEFTVAAIKPENVVFMWPIVKSMLARAIAHSNGELEIDDILKRSIDGEILIVTISQEEEVVAAIAIEQRTFNSGKRILNLTLVGGNEMVNWMDKFSEIANNLAKDYKCDEIYIVGRPGWTRTLKRLGFETVHTVVSRKVEDY